MGFPLTSDAAKAIIRKISASIILDTGPVVEIGGKVPIPVPATWSESFWGGLFKAVTALGIVELFEKAISSALGTAGIIYAKSHPVEAANALFKLWEQFEEVAPIAIGLVTRSYQHIFGGLINPDLIQANYDSVPPSVLWEIMGGNFAKMINLMLDINAVAAENKGRTSSDGSMGNFERVMGTNLTLGIKGTAVGALAHLFPVLPLEALETLNHLVVESLGLSRLSHTMLSVFSRNLIHKGIEESLLRQVKPNDFSADRAMKAYNEGRMVKATLFQILDNLGWRDDIRETEIAMNEKQFTEADVTEYFQLGWAKEADILQWARWEGFGPDRAKVKTQQIVNKRIIGILKQITDAKLSLYRDCVITTSDLTSWLKSQNYSDNEVNAVIALEELGRRTRKFLSQEDIKKAVEFGLLTLGEADAMLQCSGLTDEDAIVLQLIWFIKSLPKDCLDKIAPGDIAGAIKGLIGLLLLKGFITTSSSLVKLAACLGLVPIIPVPSGGAAAGKPAAPTGSFAVVPSIITAGAQTRMTWNIDGADPGKIAIWMDPAPAPASVAALAGIGSAANPVVRPLPDSGVVFLVLEVNTIFHLLATGPGGQSDMIASVLVHPAAAAKPPHMGPKPTASLSISPSRAAVGDLIEVRWSSNNATEGHLDTGSGAVGVETQGAKIIVAERNTVMTFTATGEGGSRSSSDSLIVHPAATPTTGKTMPTASLQISPARVHPGDQVEVRWSTANADHITLNTGGGPTAVGATGLLLLVADLTVVMSLLATGPGGSRTVLDALIVLQPPATPTPTEPLPVVELTIRPSRGKTASSYAVEWRTQHADHVTLQRGSDIQVVTLAGSRIVGATISEIWILTATGPGGSAAASRAFIVG